MRMEFKREEKLALYMFGCAKLDITIGYLHGASTLAKNKAVSTVLRSLADRLGHPSVNKKNYEQEFYRVKNDMTEDMIEAHLKYQLVYEDVENDCPWKNFAKATIIDTFCTNDLWDSMRIIRTLFCYVPDEKIKRIVQEVWDTLDDISNNDHWKYEYYLGQYKAIVKNFGKYEDYGEFGEDSILDFVWEVEDVELE